MVRYYCNYCRYKFDSKKEGMPKMCPFCSKEKTLAKDIDANSLLRDLDDI